MRQKERHDRGVYELRNITVIHCISERPVTTFIQGRQVYTRMRTAQVRREQISAGPSRIDLQDVAAPDTRGFRVLMRLRGAILDIMVLKLKWQGWG